ncbi:oligosaccharide flippase family protein [Alloalcanivorax sp. C16-2]|uniref:oligosaccharide flippase family protein n=1 Tax=Alloalcanivorax sp. C16-2 TaxID=3390052 RepID=UPI003970B80E
MKPITLARQFESTALLRGMMWLGSAQILGRCVRLGASVALARLLTPEVFGQAALILTTFELLATLIRRITSVTLIPMDDEELGAHMNRARGINARACQAAFLLMSLASLPLAFYYQDNTLIGPMVLMASAYLLQPLGMLHAALNQRRNDMRVLGRAVLWQTIADGILTTVLALLGLGIWAIIVPKLASTLVWAAVHRAAVRPPRPSARVGTQPLARRGIETGLADSAVALRFSIDTLLIGYFLGIQAVGIYFFAYNTALGISLGLIQSFGIAFYARLSGTARGRASGRAQFLGGLSTMALVTWPLILLQCALAPWYLPLVYGQQWIDAGALPIFLCLCLSALVRPMGEAAGQLLLANGLSTANLIMNLVFTLLLTAAIAMAGRWGLVEVAAAVLACHLVGMPVMAFYAWSRCGLPAAIMKGNALPPGDAS